MKSLIADYYDSLHNRTPDQAVQEAQDTISQILEAVNRGELQIEPLYRDILNRAITFINDYKQESNQQFSEIWPIELFRKKLAIIQWWHKVLVRINNDLYHIEQVYSTCTDSPRMIARLLGVQLEQINIPASNSEGDPCPICGHEHYRPEDGACANCGDTTNAEKYVMQREGATFTTFHGKICKKCGTTERYIKNHKCVSCRQTRLKELESTRYERQKAKDLKRPFVKEVMKRNGLETYEQFKQWSVDKNDEFERKKREYKARFNTPLHYEGEPCEYCGTTKKSLVTHECSKCSLMDKKQKERMIASKLETIDLTKYFYGKPCITCGSTIRSLARKQCRDCLNKNTKNYRERKLSANGVIKKRGRPKKVIEDQLIREQERLIENSL